MPRNSGTANRFAFVTNRHIVFPVISHLLVQHELHPILAFGLVGDFETSDIFCLEQVKIKQVKEMFHILDTVQVTVDIEVAVLNDIRDSFRVMLHSRNLPRLFNRAGTVRNVCVQSSDIQ